MWSRASRTCQGINEISFRASCHQELQLNVSDSNARQTLQFARRRIGSSLIDVPNFPESVHRRSGIRVDIFTPFFSSLPLFFHPFLPPFFFFHYACLRDAHRVSPVSIRAETAAEKYLALTRRSSTQMGIESRLESFSRLQPSIRACQKLKRVGRKGRFEKGVYDRRWQADGFRLRQRRGERKREIFHGFHSVVVIVMLLLRRTFFSFKCFVTPD